jgi:hypothetical protein
MALNIPMPESPGSSLLKGIDTGSTLMSRIMQPILERERLKQQQQQFVQNFALHKQAQDRANQLMPYMIQQYQDTHKTAASEAQMKDLYHNLIKEALNSPQSGSPMTPPPGMMPQGAGSQGVGADSGMSFDAKGNNNVASPQEVEQIANRGISPAGQNGMPPQMGEALPQIGAPPNANPGLAGGGQPPATPPMAPPPMPNKGMGQQQEHELRPGNPRLAKLDSVAGLVPGIPKPAQHIQNGMVFTTYPSGRMTVQKMEGMNTVSQETPDARKQREIETKIGAATGVEDAKAASKLQTSGRELQSLVSRAQKVEKLLNENPKLTGFSQGGLASLNLSESKQLAEFDQTTRKLQADMGRYGSQRGGAQALKWAEKSKPGTYKTVNYNKGMIKSILEDAKSDYQEMAQEYKDRTGKEYPIKFPEMPTSKGSSSDEKTPISKSSVTEENILHTMKETGLSRDKVMNRLKEKGLI